MTATPTIAPDTVPWLSVEQMRAVDRIMEDELGIALVQMMENAGRSLAVLARQLLGGSAAGRSVVVLAGPGGNGGGGLVAARHLHGAGADVQVVLATPIDRLAPTERLQLGILDAIGLPVAVGGAVPAADLVLDALLGYSQSGPPRAEACPLVEASRASRTLSLDVPSGLELATGVLHEPHVEAEATMTLAAPKAALATPAARGAAGELYLADIGVPPEVFERLGIVYAPPFGASPLVRIDG